jgi:hypothetical protein
MEDEIDIVLDSRFYFPTVEAQRKSKIFIGLTLGSEMFTLLDLCALKVSIVFTNY